MTELLKKTLVYVVTAAFLSLGSPVVANAEIIGTLAGIQSAQRDADLAKVGGVLAREQVRKQMQTLGVNQAQVEARLAGLTDAELSMLADEIDSMPAGAGALEVVGIVFIVLLILEAVGVLDIFKKFP